MQTTGLRAATESFQAPHSHWEPSSMRFRNSIHQEDDSYLPQDPRQWSRQDVATWLSFISRTHSLCDVRKDRFLMNGKALCLMSLHMFLARVPVGGKLLYKDFQLRLARAMYANGDE